jgi:hypothetical protein
MYNYNFYYSLEAISPKPESSPEEWGSSLLQTARWVLNSVGDVNLWPTAHLLCMHLYSSDGSDLKENTYFFILNKFKRNMGKTVLFLTF